MATASNSNTVAPWPLQMAGQVLSELGDISVFAFKTLGWSLRWPRPGTLVNSFFTVGVLSIPVVGVTGMFIGMVLAIQAYEQFAVFGLQTRLGQIINLSVVRELGPVLAATMLAGRVGSAMAAELGTMRVTEQIDALSCLGTNPIHYLVVPRFLACVLLIPLLTVLANFMGVMGGALVCTQIYGVNAHFYWQNSLGQIHLWDLTCGLIKPIFFGAAIGIIGCHRGFHSAGGAEGVGRAATTAFVASFVAILVIDFFLGLFLNTLQGLVFPGSATGGL
jgi:phospholipid/cholesterol/gamma-HCH transport system permease protein